MTFHDPLTINLARQSRSLVSKISPESPYAAAIVQASLPGTLLDTLSQVLAVPALTLHVATAFRPLLLDLCARWLNGHENADDKLVALCLLLEPHQELYPILSAFVRKTFGEKGPLAFVTTCESVDSIEPSRLHRLLLAYYRILRANRPLPHSLYWPLTPLSKLFLTPHPDTGVRLLAIHCYALQSGMCEAEQEKLQKTVLGNLCGVDCQIGCGQDVDGTPRELDGWLLPALEVKRITDARNALIIEPKDFYCAEEGDHGPSLTPSDLSPFIANVHGVLFLRFPGPSETLTPLILTPTAVQALRSLATRLSLRVPTLLTSPPSSGKSLFLSHLAEILYPGSKSQIITIHLADTSLDARSLLGSYVSSSTQPGIFEWKDGVIVRAMREGKWLVFEDIDKGSNEVLGVIKPLVESLGLGKWVGGCATLEVPSRGRVEADESFALFATRSLVPSRTGQFPTPVFFGAHKFHEVIIPSPTPEELKTILDSWFPRLAGSAALALIRLWEDVRALGAVVSSRDVSLRELVKFCTRVDNLLPSSHRPMDPIDDANNLMSLSSIFPNPTLREDMYLEARDVFFGAGTLTAPARAHVERIAATVAEDLGLESERSSWVLQGRTPEFEIEKDVNGRTTAVRAGRTRIPARSTKVEISPPPTRPFALHRPAVLLLSRIAIAVSIGEPVLLCGETGTGKTSIVTHLASLLRRPLISLNLSHQTESADLLGGFKPVDARVPGSVLQERFLELFSGTFSRRKNAKFEDSVRKAVSEAKWKRAIGLWKESVRLAKDKIQAKQDEEPIIESNRTVDQETPRKKRKVEISLNISAANWNAFEQNVDDFNVQHVQGKGKFAFGFVEGPLVKALRSGDWILLDEINLASPETLECISSLLHGPTASITLTEQGSLEPVLRHPDFRLFACMNPATDVGKKDLPPNIRSRFTEIDVPPPDSDRETLLSVVTQYIGPSSVGDKAAIMDVAEFYSAVKKLAEGRHIVDGSNHKPHYSMRTLARALTFAADIASTYGLRRAVWEGCLMAFTMVLDAPSAQVVTTLAQKHLLAGVRNPRSLLSKEPTVSHSRLPNEFLKLGPFYLERGPIPEDLVEDYIMTPSVETKLVDLARIILTRRFPVLIEGPTSSGKTSSVEYLARRTGHQFIRINNHEHTDIQEYLGSYVSDPTTGKLVFKDGLLVRALRNGDWIVLDELNLAPTDVLEALNRLLDDNRELVIPETQEVVRPHPHFMLFATQNPPGLYAGRKVLSRAFRNRFLEVQFEDVPQAELETILCQRCRIAPSYGLRIVSVFRELQKRRQSSRVFESKHGFATLRDLFRWAGRDAVGYQELAQNGYMLLAERARREEDKIVVKEVIESIMKVRIDEKTLYGLDNPAVDFTTLLGFPFPSSSSLVWTAAMRRLFILVSRALRFNEPILLVGETGSGKTSVCQVYADAVQKRLISLNCHQNTETADLIGGLRPVRNRAALETDVLREAVTALESIGVKDVVVDARHLLAAFDDSLKLQLEPRMRLRLEGARRKILRLNAIFEWHDGPLVEAMRAGEVFLLDEISLADDSVLERLNSVLEPSRTVVLAERGGDDLEHSAVRAVDAFKLVATMNPGGDYGKKELSPALRNRFTEIWVPPVDDRKDLELIVDNLWSHENFKPYTVPLLDFVEWVCARVADRSLLSLRDILAWVTFSNAAYHPEDEESMPSNEIYHHAAHMTFLDGLASLPQLAAYSAEDIRRVKADALSKLQELVPLCDSDGPFAFVPALDPTKFLQLGSFAVPKGPGEPTLHSFNLQAPTTRDNAMRIVRACQVAKPILLEGSPGVGKTSLITALANLSGHRLCRLNLSDQTDLVDLFGSDFPVKGGGPGEFAWKDAEFLRALQEGHWVLLDEMNLAPQAVLEGLNAVLDHRGTVFIPELGRSFTRHPSFRIFAAQNPLQQGGGRKGLPRSFVNRFSKVYVEELSPSDLMLVCRHIFPDCDMDILRAMIEYNARLNEEIVLQRSFARVGSPWEFNLRDVIRWGILLRGAGRSRHPVEYLHSIYLHRFRTVADREHARLLFDRIFSIASHDLDRTPHVSISSSFLQIGQFNMPRSNAPPASRPGCFLQMHHSALEAAGHCVTHSWLVIITGPQGSGKTNVVRVLAHVTGNYLQEISMNSATDAMDILGSFEQVDNRGRIADVVQRVLSLAHEVFRDGTNYSIYQSDDYYALRKEINQLPTSNSSGILRSALNVLVELDNTTGHKKIESDWLQSRIRELLELPDGLGRFEWVDGPLVRALKYGYWLLLEGANLCNPSVLDRLNSLCEPGGVLTLTEKGYVDGDVQTIKPHPNFRLFMSVDPQYGELSRAMRNRGLEIALLTDTVVEDRQRLQDHYSFPLAISAQNSDWTFLSAHYDSIRRGLVPPNLEYRLLGSEWPSGRVADLDSASLNLVHLASFLSISPSVPPHEISARSHLFSRATPPAYIPYFYRFLSISELNPYVQSQIRNVLETLADHRLPPILSDIRQNCCRSWGIPSEFVLAQPMNVYMKCVPCSDCEIPGDSPSVHRLIMQVLNLLVALIMDKMEMAVFDRDRNSRVSSGQHVKLRDSVDASRRVLNAIDTVLNAIPVTANAVLDHLGDAVSFQKHVELDVAVKLFGYGRSLRKIAAANLFDYSAAQATSNWIAESIQGCSVDFSPIHDPARGLRDAVSLSSGLGITEIWSTLSVQRSCRLSSTELRSLESMACDIDPAWDIHGLRMQIFQLIALHTLVALPTDDEQRNLIEFDGQVRKQLLASRRTTTPPPTAQQDNSSLISELRMLLELGGIESIRIQRTTIRLVHKIIDVACDTPDASLLRFTSYQHLIWATEANKTQLPIIVECQLQWLDAIWSLTSTSGAAIGPSMLLSPILLHQTIQKCDWKGNSMSSLTQYEASIRRHVQLALMQCGSKVSRTDQLSGLLLQAMLMLSACFGNSFGGDARRLITRICENCQLGAPSLMVELVEIMEKSTNPALSRAVQQLLHPSILRFASHPQLQGRNISGLGRCWIALSRVFVDLYVPDAPIDPAAAQQCALELWRHEELTLHAQVELQRQVELRTAGNNNNAVIAYLEARLNEVRQYLTELTSGPPHNRRDITQLHAFWSEIFQFQTQVISSSKIDSLLGLFEAGDSSAAMREQVIQESVAGFCQRLESVYPDFEDIRTPFQQALLYLRLGLRLVAHAGVGGVRNSSDSLNHISTGLVAFPSIQSAAMLSMQSPTNNAEGVPPFRRILLTVAAIALERSLGVDVMTNIRTIETIYEQAFRLWSIDRARENQKIQESESLYRRKALDHDAANEDEIEEQEFLELFPTFEDVMDEGRSLLPPGKNSDLVDSSQIQLLASLHHSLLGTSGDAGSDAHRTFQDLRTTAMISLLESHMPSLPDVLDNESLTLQHSLLRDRLFELSGCHDPAKKSYDFYTDANIQEVKKATLAVESLRNRLEVLIREWPDQMVLQHLKHRCDGILSLDLHSSVAKVLSALEQLLLQTQDWEIYANRENTLKDHQQSLIGLIVEWRRLELSCWQMLLQSQAQSFANGASESWFRLYDISVRGALAAADDESRENPHGLAQYLNQFVPLLDEFVRSSPLGQYESRMRLLQTFESYVDCLSLAKKGKHCWTLQRVRRLLHATSRYYNLFSPQIVASLSEQRATLEREIQAFIKLASWKDINVHALKQSAQRTHHNLYKIVRKFRDVMRQPITAHLQPIFAGDSECKHMDMDLYTDVSTATGQPSFPAGDTVLRAVHLVDLDRTYRKFDSFITNRIRRSTQLHSSITIDDLATHIIVIAKGLAGESIPKELSAAKRVKQHKALLVRKRKAWSDLLKEMKRGGLSVNLKPDVLRQQSDSLWIREQPVFSTAATKLISTVKVDLYFDRLHAALPQLRTSLSDHHSDVTTKDLRRAVMLLESGFAHALEARSSLAGALEVYANFNQLSRRLHAFSTSKTLAFVLPVYDEISRLKTIACKLADALNEVVRALITFDDLQPSSGTISRLIEDVRIIATTTSASRDRLTELMLDLEVNSSLILLASEFTMISDISQQFKLVSTSLVQWSKAEPTLEHVFRPVQTWLDGQGASSVSPIDPQPALSPACGTDSIIDTLLINVQAMLLKCPVAEGENTADDNDNFIRDGSRFFSDLTGVLRIDGVLSQLLAILPQLASSPQDDLQRRLLRLLPFLDRYSILVREQLVAHCQWTQALFKLDFILCSLLHTIAKQGFCKPPEADESGSVGDTTDAAGVGLGEGSGMENVSKEIEDESQVEGIQGDEDGTNDPRDDAEDDNTIEMSEDFGGVLEDVPDDVSENDGESDEESEGEPEEQLGDLDASDPTAVDEKIWGDEQGPQGKDEAGKTNEDRSEERKDDSDVVAKDDEQPHHKEPKEMKGDEDDSPKTGEDAMSQEDAELDDRDEHSEANGAPVDDHAPDANTLDLPDDMDLRLGDDMPEPDLAGESEEDLSDAGGPDNQNAADDTITEAESPPSPEAMDDDLPGQTQEAGDSGDIPEEEHTQEIVVPRPDVSAGDNDSAPNEPHDANVEAKSMGLSSSGLGGAQGQSTGDTDQHAEPSDSDHIQDEGPPDPPDKAEDVTIEGSAANGPQQGSAPSQPYPQMSKNPLRSLGDALSEIRQRFDEILDSQDLSTSHRDHRGDSMEASQVEYLRPDDVDHDMQALGPAGEEQVAKLNDLKLIDDDGLMLDSNLPMDIDPPVSAPPVDRPSHPPSLNADPMSQALVDNIDGALTQSDVHNSVIPEASDLPSRSSAIMDDVEMEDATDDTVKDVEAELRQWHVDGQPDAGAEHIWRLYESLTHDLSYALCEQLRLILEPTLATRLKGDYRTGKRLNMKKIIPYIASDYTKDKIWLRRTRPSQREYQVLIALDDSRSMAESHSVHLAYETMALVSKALGRLEVGDIAIAKFGESVEILHGFDEGPFTDQAGSKVMNAFQFNQKATNVLALIETSLKVLEVARERRSMTSASAADLWQLEIIISDGICQDHDRLRTVLRKAEEQRVMIVFIVIDSLHSAAAAGAKTDSTVESSAIQSSILAMNQVAYKNVDGRMELQMERYLDSFPFEYYVVLRNVEALPEVLTGTLKQFFERISEE